MYASTTRNFEEIALKFIMASSSDGLECIIFKIKIVRLFYKITIINVYGNKKIT